MALVVNELVQNALKYAFPSGQAGRIGIELHSGRPLCQLTVWDNGDNKDGKTSTANFLSGMLKSLPPLEEVYNMAGLSLPKIVAPQKAEDESAEGKNEEKTEAEPKKNK